MRPLLARALAPALVALTLSACSGDDTGGGGGTTAAMGTTAATTVATTAATTVGGASTGDTGTVTASTGVADSTGDAVTTDAPTTGETTDGTVGDSTGAVAFTLTSPAFAEGGDIPGAQHIAGGNVHPELNWVGAPAGTLSFGVFFYDLSISNPHSGIWNISADATGLPEGVEGVAMPPSVPGAVQCRNWTGGFGYGGMGTDSNTYEFTVYALDTDDLSAEIDENTSLDQVRNVLIARSLGQATLSGVSTGP